MAAKAHLNALEYEVFQKLLKASKFRAVLNEKVPAKPHQRIALRKELKARIVSTEVSKLRDHPDLRIARRALTLSRLAQVISERKVGKGLRMTLLTQAKRLEWLAERRVAKAPEVSESDESDA